MIKHLLTVASLVLLAGCASMGGSDGDSVNGLGTPGAGVENVSPEVLKLRRQLAEEAGDRVFFDYDSSAISAEGQKTLTEIAKFIKDSSKVESVNVEGHCDERGTREYNLALGERRAVAVKKFLIGAGVDASLITTISYGKERPAVEGHDEESWTKNRRGVVVLN